MTKAGGEPSKNSFNDMLRTSLAERYKAISFKEHILKWLKKCNAILENDNGKMLTIKSALIQYEDHLNGLFLLREGEKTMNENMKKFVKEKLEIQEKSNNFDIFEIANEYQEYINELNEYLEGIKKDAVLKILSNYDQLVLENLTKKIREKKLGLDIKVNFWPSSVHFGEQNSLLCITPLTWKSNYHFAIGFDKDFNDIIYGITLLSHDKEHDENIRIKLKEIFKDEYVAEQGISEFWLYWEKIPELSTIENINNLVDYLKNKNGTVKFIEEITSLFLDFFDKTREIL